MSAQEQKNISEDFNTNLYLQGEDIYALSTNDEPVALNITGNQPIPFAMVDVENTKHSENGGKTILRAYVGIGSTDADEVQIQLKASVKDIKNMFKQHSMEAPSKSNYTTWRIGQNISSFLDAHLG